MAGATLVSWMPSANELRVDRAMNVDGASYVDVVSLEGVDVVVVDGGVDGRRIGDLVRVRNRLVSVRPMSDTCAWCSEARVMTSIARFGLLPLCPSHAYSGRWVTAQQRRATLEQMAAEGRPPGAMSAYFHHAIRRSPRA